MLKIMTSIITLYCLILSNIVIASSDKVQWSYDGHEGPANWGALSKNYDTCKSGQYQSPIDINSTTTAKLANIKFNYLDAPIDLINNGHTIQMNYAKGSTLVVGGKTYRLLQFHFHSPSEHHVNGKPYDMVAHLVHQADDGQLGVIGIMMKVGNSNPVIDAIWSHMPKNAGDHNNVNSTINVAKLLPANHNYFNYSGSLTTPPCSEGVNWMVLQTPIEVSAEQVASFANIFKKNVRPIQPLHSRKIHMSN